MPKITTHGGPSYGQMLAAAREGDTVAPSTLDVVEDPAVADYIGPTATETAADDETSVEDAPKRKPGRPRKNPDGAEG